MDIYPTPATRTARVALIATGGTISCTADRNGALVPALSAEDLLAAAITADPTLEEIAQAYPVDANRLDSSSLSFADLDGLVACVHRELSRPDTTGVVITHGTDSMEDTASVLAAYFGAAPIVLTGAQRPADADSPDGPMNLARALRHAAHAAGCAICFGGHIIPALGAVKRHTSELSAFVNVYEAAGEEVPQLPVLPRAELSSVNVPVIAAFPGAGHELIDAAVAGGANGLVVEALGAGNMGTGMGEGVRDALTQGIPVVITTRVPLGEVAFSYGGAGGGATLAEHGALASGRLRAGQSRVLLAAALASSRDPHKVFAEV